MTGLGTIISSGKSMLLVLCLAIGTVIGELIGIELGYHHCGLDIIHGKRVCVFWLFLHGSFVSA